MEIGPEFATLPPWSPEKGVVMSTRVKLTIMDGDLKEKELQCDGYTRCLIGRAEDCDIQLPTDFLHADISRHHCVLEVEPPHIWVRDLGSLNGTFVNGELIGQRPKGKRAHVEAPPVCAERELEDGDQIRVGTVLLNLSISAPSDAFQPTYIL